MRAKACLPPVRGTDRGPRGPWEEVQPMKLDCVSDTTVGSGARPRGKQDLGGEWAGMPA